jgi:basic amino acid/polyamine antiporter, APA family
MSNLAPLIPEDQGYEGIIQASNLLFFTYMGFDFISTLSEESINPKRDVPRAMVISIIAITFIYSLLAFAVTGMGHISKEETALVMIF